MIQRIEVRRTGRMHSYDVSVDGRFAAIVSRACYSKRLGAAWVVTLRHDLGSMQGVFKSRDDALEAVHLALRLPRAGRRNTGSPDSGN